MSDQHNDLPEPAWVATSATIIPPSRRTDVVSCVIDREIVLSEPDRGDVYYLNETASAVWTSCDGATSTRDMAEALVARFEVPFELALDNVEQVAAWFAESDLLETPDQ
ncbi:MAG: PqqD family protein [Phycisphaerales bacterium]|nr:MAG: PqqD family protein [Phycisphaerales bacterium]